MSDFKPSVGSIGWIDLTVDDAEGLRDFYADVVGWKVHPVSMGDYEDFTMIDAESGEARVGVCHGRGGNAGLPASWMIYITVADLDESIAKAEARGGEVIHGPKDMGSSARYCMVRDPAGAVFALFQNLD